MDLDDDDNFTGSDRVVLVRFITKLEPRFRIPSNSSSVAVPSNFDRKLLSDTVNGLLEAGNDEWKPEVFDFLIDGELIRLPLEEFLIAKGISAERTVEIEYIRAVVPRKEEVPSLHDDWVSAVDGSNSRFFLTGCYDGKGRIWKGAGACTHILEGHGDAVTAVSVVPQKDRTNGTDVLVATASKDRTLKLWTFDIDAEADSTKILPLRTLRGHTAAVQSVAAQPSGDMVCSGSWDCRINLWETRSSDEGGELISTKKRKKENVDEESQSEAEAVSTLVGHTQCVSSVVWPQNGTIYSASWDHSIRGWDVESGKVSLNLLYSKVFNCLDIRTESSALIAAGGSDPILRIWDPRIPGTLAPIYQFSSHTSWVTSCKWHRSSSNHLLSSSYDGKVMLWDLRTAFPVAVISSHQDKVLCADWWNDDSVISGGVDSKLCMSSNIFNV